MEDQERVCVAHKRQAIMLKIQIIQKRYPGIYERQSRRVTEKKVAEMLRAKRQQPGVGK